MKAIIFGSNGQDGYYLHQLLNKEKIETIGVSRKGNWLIGNVGDWKFVEEIVKREKPAYIFHLAANSTTRHEALFENHETICSGTLYILEAVKLHSPATKVFISGSGLQFENKGLPIKETDPFEAGSPYAFSRIHSTYAARYYRKLGIQAYVGYFFNHESPRRTERHVSRMISEACRRIHLGSTEKIELGDTSVRKEWTYAGDVVEGIWKLCNQDHIMETVIGSGKAYSIENWLEVCFNIIGRDWKEYTRIKPQFTPEYRVLVSDPSTLQKLGWQDQVDLEQLAQLMMA